jgi:hypothetical protein
MALFRENEKKAQPSEPGKTARKAVPLVSAADTCDENEFSMTSKKARLATRR